MDKCGAHKFGSGSHEEQERDGMCAVIDTRDSLSFGPLAETGGTYIHHCGGPERYLKITGPDQIGVADCPGNQTSIAKSYEAANDHVLFKLVDCAFKARSADCEGKAP